MFVQRLRNWLRRVFATLTTHPRAAQPLHSGTPAVMSGCAAGQRASGRNTASTTGSWLDDGRGLRPRPITQSTPEPRWTIRSVTPRQQSADQPAQHRRSAPSRPVPAHPAAETTPVDTSMDTSLDTSLDTSSPRPQPPEPKQPMLPAPPVPPAQPARLTPASLGSPDAHGVDAGDSGIRDQALYRRLMSLKRLVRLGIYGEGFDPRNVPDQYLHSLGRDGDFEGFDDLDDFDNFDTFDTDWNEPRPGE